MFRLPTKRIIATAGLLALASPGVWAKSADRGLPMDIEAGATSGSLDDRQPTVLSQGVTISQGSLQIESNTATVTTRGGEPVRAVLTGGPVKLKQQLDDGTPMNATAGRVDYDLVTEIVIFTENVNIQQPRGTLSGPRVVYNMKTGMVNSNADSSGRVKMRINPRTRPAAAPVKPATAPKKSGTN
ncbi:MAG TPA: lipopolysaccharide transport periplasmic protein LptA [Lysobacter sp.]|jgi:lipopolysaccharide export system protein LptA|nr:lipopolysaccharide transport periplasmic protein LptA [Lysobacter sp.]